MGFFCSTDQNISRIALFEKTLSALRVTLAHDRVGVARGGSRAVVELAAP